MVTSSISGEGKSFVACNLAISLALAGKKVVLMEADMYKPKITSVFQLPNGPGLSEILAFDEQDTPPFEKVIYPTSENKNLFVIPGGRVPNHPTELLMNKQLESLMQYLTNRFDIIIIDAVPINPVSDAFIIGRYADFSLFVVRHAVTPKINLQALDSNLEVQRLKDVHIVFNAIKRRGWVTSGWGYGYGYGYSSNIGYGYFGKDQEKYHRPLKA